MFSERSHSANTQQRLEALAKVVGLGLRFRRCGLMVGVSGVLRHLGRW
ncbi:hypothetical protein H6G68_12210 [Anabaena catenula FACHB-362]|uniref:Mobile element protein n=1 Tax=Anabaena catenula FACHB-362 TaxID=2692877 RepID=A0ABR8J2D3_9NOST|nr:hypothetical protein [Anabaena catenula FACHB-362]